MPILLNVYFMPEKEIGKYFQQLMRLKLSCYNDTKVSIDSFLESFLFMNHLLLQ